MDNKKYFVDLKDGKMSIYTKFKGFFREKIKKVSLNEFFLLGKNSLKKSNSYEMLPQVDGISPTSYLYQKSLFNLDNKESDFGKRTIWRISNPSIESRPFVLKETTYYETFLRGNLKVSDESGRIILEEPDYRFFHLGLEKIDVRFVELLNQNASNGVLQTARETFELVDMVTKNLQGNNAVLKCEECGEIFHSIPEFYSHLIENKHYDSILDSNIYDPEVIRIRNLVKGEA